MFDSLLKKVWYLIFYLLFLQLQCNQEKSNALVFLEKGNHLNENPQNTDHKFIVTYQGNNQTFGIAPVDSNNYSLGQTAIVANSSNLIRSGYSFVGWNTQNDGLGINYLPFATFSMPNSNLTLFANWQVSAAWARATTQAPDISQFKAVVADTDGNLLVVGSQYGNGTYSYGQSVNVTGSASAAINSVIIKYNPLGQVIWAQSVSGTSSDTEFNAVAVDQKGNVYAAGYQSSDNLVSYGNNVAVAGFVQVANNCLLVKYNPQGLAQWAKSTVAGASFCKFNSIALDSMGNIIVVGQIYGNGPYGYGNNVTVNGSHSGYNLLIVKYNTNGEALWARSTTAGIKTTIAHGVTADKNDAIIVAGQQSGNSAMSYGLTVTATGVYNSDSNALLLKYDSTGSALWARTITSGADDSRFYSVKTDSLNNIVAVGYLNGNGSYFFDASVSVNPVYASSRNLAIVKYDSTGQPVWAKSTSVALAATRYSSVVIDNLNNIYAVGAIYGTSNYNLGNSITVVGNFNGYNALLAKYNSAGQTQWAKSTVSASQQSEFLALAINKNNEIFAAGFQNGTGFYSFGTNQDVTAAYSTSNSLLVKYLAQ